MGVYDARCRKCGKVTEYYQSAARCYETPECCGESMEKVILTAPMGWVEKIEYTSPIDGRPILTKQDRLNDLARNGCRPWEGIEQEQKEASRRAAYEEQKQDKEIETAVVEAWQTLTPEKQAVLSESA